MANPYKWYNSPFYDKPPMSSWMNKLTWNLMKMFMFKEAVDLNSCFCKKDR